MKFATLFMNAHELGFSLQQFMAIDSKVFGTAISEIAYKL